MRQHGGQCTKDKCVVNDSGILPSDERHVSISQTTETSTCEVDQDNSLVSSKD